MSESGDYISREAFLAEKRHLYCENCARRKGMKNGKMKFVYEIGDAPCRACGIGDVLDDVEDFPAADAIEKLSAYVRQIEELRKDGYYLQKTKMMTDGQAIMTMPLPEPPKEEET